jgi:PAT family beta-lactamase induction signal transducer AmpG
MGAEAGKLSGWKLFRAAMTNRKLAIMLIFGFASGLPNVLLLGTLYAWLGEEQVDLETMGVFSLIGLAYAFKFLWSPAVDAIRLPLLGRLGRRRGWLLPIQLFLATSFILLSRLDPSSYLGWFSLIAGVGAFLSATQDIVIDAWRVDVADEVATLEILSAVTQLGYRVATLVGGALALILAARIGWDQVYLGLGVAMFAAVIATLFAPDTPRVGVEKRSHAMQLHANLPPKIRNGAIALVGAAWAWAIVTVISFMASSLTAEPELRPDATAFIKFTGPFIVIATVLVPAVIAAILNGMSRHASAPAADALISEAGALRNFMSHCYEALLMPLAEIVGRLKWGAVIALGIILTYRLTDSVWGPFALPFYLQELGYSNDQVAFASKFFGVGMTMLGIAMGALLFVWAGRLFTLLLGAVLAAATNLLYADLASGGAAIDMVGQISGFYAVASWFGGEPVFARLLLAIAGENLAGGIAGAAFVAYLSSITSKQYSAVQYALLSSLTFLVGALGRGAVGEAIERDGYAYVFIFAAALGLIAIVLCFVEWARAGFRKGTPIPSVE